MRGKKIQVVCASENGEFHYWSHKDGDAASSNPQCGGTTFEAAVELAMDRGVFCPWRPVHLVLESAMQIQGITGIKSGACFVPDRVSDVVDRRVRLYDGQTVYIMRRDAFGTEAHYVINWPDAEIGYRIGYIPCNLLDNM